METKTSIMKRLNKKAHPDGFINFKFVISKVGEHDYKNSQLCIQDECYLTPWIQERIRCLGEYKNKVYCQVDEALKSFANTVGCECKELELLIPGNVPKGLDPENQERLSAAYAAKQAQIQKRRSEILIHLSELNMEIESIDAALQHHLQRAENVIMKHISCYWKGILKAAGNTDMPSKPDVELPVIPGQKVYETHFKYIKQILTKGVSQSDYSDLIGYDKNFGKIMGGAEDDMVQA